MDISVIRDRIRMIEELEKDNKVSKEMVKSELEADSDYVDAVKEGKEINAKKKRLKDTILGREGIQKTVFDIKANDEEIATLREILSAELIEFYQEKKTDEIEDAQGVKRKFKFAVRLSASNKSRE